MVAGAWYFEHRGAIHQLFLAHSAYANTVEANPFGGPYPTLLSFKNLSWYFWDAANIQLRAGLLLLFLVGTVFGDSQLHKGTGARGTSTRSCWVAPSSRGL